MNKMIIALLFGGKSTEHTVSIDSARNVFPSFDKKKYSVIPIFIDEAGFWRSFDDSRRILEGKQEIIPEVNRSVVSFVPNGSGDLISLPDGNAIHIDAVFSVLHGTFGEDGSMQGLLEIADVPYIGSGVLGSAIGMDKRIFKRVLRDEGICTAPFVEIFSRKRNDVSFHTLSEKLSLPFFIKPSNSGSSVGVWKVFSEKDFLAALTDAFQYDSVVLAEKYIRGREIECSVLGNENPKASIPGEVLPKRDFYSYEAKYVDKDGADIIVPAKLPMHIREKIQEMSIRVFTETSQKGFARVDFFVDGKDIYLNEINTLPGFTPISMYPKLWEASGTSPSQLLDVLVQLSLDHHKKKRSLLRKYKKV